MLKDIKTVAKDSKAIYALLPSDIDEANSNNFASQRNNQEHNRHVLHQVGLVDLVFPSDKVSHNKKHAKSFKDKLCEFVYYQPLSSHKAPETPGAIKLSSSEGKRMLKEALDTPYMEAFFTVGPQIDNQPVFCCGSMSLVVALNSLDIDPARPTWSEEWRWNHLGSLTCCTPVLQNPNVSLVQLGYLAVCNDTRALTKLVTDDWTLDEFRSWLKMALSRSDMIMVVNHGRREMLQAGSGHFLPMTGYHEAKDMVLTYDIAKHKYVPEWFPLQRLFTSIKAKDDRSGLNRGFALLMRPDYESSERLFGLSLVFRLDDLPGNTDPRLKEFFERWNRYLDEQVPAHSSREDIIKTTIRYLLSSTKTSFDDSKLRHHTISLMELTLKYFRHHYLVDSRNSHTLTSIIARCRRPQCPNHCPNTSFLRQIESLTIFQIACDVIESLTNEERGQVLDLVVPQFDDVDAAVHFAWETSQCQSTMERTVEFFRNLRIGAGDGLTGAQNGFSNWHQPNMNTCPGFIELFPEHIATFFLLTWPNYSYDKEEIFSHTSFNQILEEYNLPHLDHTRAESVTRQNGKEVKLDCLGEGSNIEIYRECLNRLVREDVNALSNHCHRILLEQIKSIKRKLTAVLDYHNLQH